jgi:hypothetical protein
MATTYKVLGQVEPTATTATTAYTVPSATETVVSTLNIVNISTNPDAVRVAIRPNGETLADKHYIIYGLVLPAFGQYSLQAGITLDATDVITVYSTNGTSAFNLFGSEIS